MKFRYCKPNHDNGYKMMHMNKRLLIVEDDSDDRELLYEAVQQVNPSVQIDFAENGLEALRYLNHLNEKNAKPPCLIVLDLNMPLIDGKETYQKIKSDMNLLSVPIIIFTSSHNPNDKEMFERLGVEFISKPDSFSMMNDIVSHMIRVCENKNA